MKVSAGLIAATKNKVEHKFPLLHRIPFIGKRLFIHYEELVQKTDLVIQVRPKIVYDNYTGIEKNKYHIENSYTQRIDLPELNSGIYFIQLRSSLNSITRKITIIK